MINKYAKSAGKGDRPRPTKLKEFGKNYESIFGKKKFNGRHFKTTYPEQVEEYSCVLISPPGQVNSEAAETVFKKLGL